MLASAVQMLSKAEGGCHSPHIAWEAREKTRTAKLGEQRISQSVVLAVNPLGTHYTQLLVLVEMFSL